MQSLGACIVNGTLRRSSLNLARTRLRLPTGFGSRIIRRKFCTEGQGTVSSTLGQGNLNKASFVSRRLIKLITIFGSLGSLVYVLHEKEMLYRKVIQQCLLYKGHDPEKKSKMLGIYQWILTGWGYFRSWEPKRFYNCLDELIDFLGTDYPIEIRTGALMLLVQVIGYDPNSMPPPVGYDKCYFKKKLLESSRGEKLMQSLYNLTAEVKHVELMMMTFDLLTKFAIVPREPSQTDIEKLMKDEDAPYEVVYMCLIRHQQIPHAREAIRFLKTKDWSKYPKPEFVEIKRLLVKFKALEFALNCWKSPNQILKQSAFQMIPLLIADFPDYDELIASLGSDDREIMLNRKCIEEILSNMGQHHFQRNENHAAIKALDQAERMGGINPVIAYIKGMAYRDLENIDMAEGNFKLALTMSRGQFGESRLELANLLLKYRGEEGADEAVNHLAILTNDKNNPKVEDVYFRLLFALEKIKDYDMAFQYMRELCKYKATNTQAAYEAGRMGNLSGEHELAERYLRRCLDLEPARTDTKYQLALAISLQGELDEEVDELLESVLRSRPDHVKALQLGSRICVEKQDWLGALDCIEKILLNKPNLIPFLLQKSEIQDKLFDYENEFITYGSILKEWSRRLDKQPDYFQKRSKEQYVYRKVQKRVKRRVIHPGFNTFKEDFKAFQEKHADNLPQ